VARARRVLRRRRAAVALAAPVADFVREICPRWAPSAPTTGVVDDDLNGSTGGPPHDEGAFEDDGGPWRWLVVPATSEDRNGSVAAIPRHKDPSTSVLAAVVDSKSQYISRL